MAKKKRKRQPKPDAVQAALRVVEKATGEKLSKPAKQPNSNGKA